jgi:NifB/MoaA-like Fe-S oxidoreductase
LERSINELASLWPAVQSISVVPVGLTKHHKYTMRPHTAEEAAETLDYVEALQPQYQERFGKRFVYPTDEWYLVSGRDIPALEAYDGQQLQENGLGMSRRFLDDWEVVKEEIEGNKQTFNQTVTLATGTLFGPVLETAAAEFAALTGVNLQVQHIINERLGDTITAAGLLMAEDVIAQLKTAGHGDLVILPRIIFDHPDVISLDDMTPQQVANELGVPVALADLMGDIWDALVGESAVLFEPVSGLIQIDAIQS